VDGLDFSPAMVRLAQAKLAGSSARVREGDAGDPGLATASVDVVLGRHVLWVLSARDLAVARWVRALWGREITDERYLVVAPLSRPAPDAVATGSARVAPRAPARRCVACRPEQVF
jgi:SAM-dependent methyltransferase